MPSWTWVISSPGGHTKVTRDEEAAWNAGRRPGAAVIAIPMIDMPVEPDPPVDLDREQLGRDLDEPRKLKW